MPPKDPDYAKFQFYSLTRYDRFTHYDTSLQKYRDFDCSPNLTDGVDKLGCMIRYHIDHCLLNVPAWYTSLVPSAKGTSYYSSLAYLLLFDGSIKPTKNRLTDRIERFLDSKNDDVIEQYRAYNGDSHQIISLLDRLREKENLHFNSAHVFSGEETLSDPNITQCERMVLEYAIRERYLEDCRNNLRNKAEELFPSEWFLSKRVFWSDK